jgi:hypothetical protein
MFSSVVPDSLPVAAADGVFKIRFPAFHRDLSRSIKFAHVSWGYFRRLRPGKASNCEQLPIFTSVNSLPHGAGTNGATVKTYRTVLFIHVGGEECSIPVVGWFSRLRDRCFECCYSSNCRHKLIVDYPELAQRAYHVGGLPGGQSELYSGE